MADRVATRWPEHDEETPAGRPIGWRTAVCAAFGAFAFAVLPMRFEGDQLALALFGAWFVTLILGMATDLDQRLLPNVLTLPVIPVALVYAVSGRNPLVGADLLPAIVVATAVPIVLYLLSIPFGAGAFGIGDAKLLVGVGLMAGGIRAFTGLVSGLVRGRRRARRPARRQAGHDEDLRPVRPVPDLRGHLGHRRHSLVVTRCGQVR